MYTIGRVNFLADPSQRPHLRTDEMAGLLGVKQQTMANKGRLIMDTFRISLMDPEWSRQDMIEKNPLAWLVEVNGMPVDVRMLPEEIQGQAWRRGLIPFMPAQTGAENSAARP